MLWLLDQPLPLCALLERAFVWAGREDGSRTSRMEGLVLASLIQSLYQPHADLWGDSSRSSHCLRIELGPAWRQHGDSCVDKNRSSRGVEGPVEGGEASVCLVRWAQLTFAPCTITRSERMPPEME